MTACLHADISQDHGMGEESMMSFIHEHLNCILEPFTRSVNDLHGVVNQLVLRAEEAASHGQQLQDQSKLLKLVQADMRATKQRLLDVKEGQEKQVQELNAQLVSVASDATEAKGHCLQLDQEHRQSRSFLWDVQQSNAAMEVELRRHAAELASDKVQQQLDAALRGLRADVSSLNRGQEEAMASLGSAQERVEKYKDEWDTFRENSGYQRRQEEMRMKELRGGVQNLERELLHTNAQLKGQAAQARSTHEDLSTLIRRHEQTMRMQVVQERQQQESNERQAAFEQRLELLKADIQNVMESLGLTEGAANLVETVQRLKESSAQHEDSLQLLCQESCDHAKNIHGLQLRADAADEAAGALQDEDKRIEESMLQSIEKLRNSFCVNEQRDQELFQEEVRARTKGDEECLAELKAQQKESTRLQDLLNKLGLGVDSCTNKVQSLEKKLASTEDQLSSLGGSMDLTQEYWKGLTRGIQETHRKVASTERVPLKSPRAEETQPQRGLGRGLPALTKTAGAGN
ncbi:unnamed protein product [Effrenium voratum]|uniref:Uncharacterized protein n=1 Tax=Effrenium voratum TaxID=2562239 RepID=A0AA36JD10_9DINO|nr:unnamed protein product [Effrenium voratum]CAJ1460745.1 unnamed protein product [Effrenium voratum]